MPESAKRDWHLSRSAYEESRGERESVINGNRNTNAKRERERERKRKREREGEDSRLKEAKKSKQGDWIG